MYYTEWPVHMTNASGAMGINTAVELGKGKGEQLELRCNGFLNHAINWRMAELSQEKELHSTFDCCSKKEPGTK